MKLLLQKRGLIFCAGLLLFLANSGVVWAQKPVCGTDELTTQRIATDDAYRQFISRTKQITPTKASSTTYIIPIAFVVYHLGESVGTGNNVSDAELQAQLDALNQRYAAQSPYNSSIDTKIQFVLAKRTETCTASTGIARINASGVSSYVTDGLTSYANAYSFIQNFPGFYNSTNANGFITVRIVRFLSFAAGFAGLSGGDIFIDRQDMQSSTTILAHEVGHVLSLYHTFEGSTQANPVCPSNANPSLDGDAVADTDPHRYGDFTCTSSVTNICTNLPFGNLGQNTMNYACATLFSQGQVDRMRNFLEVTLPSLANSIYTVSPNANEVLTTAACSVTYTNAPNSYNMGISRFVFNTIDRSSTVYVQPGSHYQNYSCETKTTVQAGNTYTLQVIAEASQNRRVYIDYNNDGSFNETNERVFATSSGASTTSISIPTSATTNTYLRVRVIADPGNNNALTSCLLPGVSTFGCGEAEDYSLLILPASTPPTAPTVTLSQAIACQNTPVSVTVTCPTGTTVSSLSTATTGTFTYAYACPASGTAISPTTSVTLTVNAAPAAPTGGNTLGLGTCQYSGVSSTISCPVGTTLIATGPASVSGNALTYNTGTVGSFTVTLRCQNAAGCYSPGVNTPFSVSLSPASGPTLVGSTLRSVCQNSPLSLSATCPANSSLVGLSSSLTVVGNSISVRTTTVGTATYDLACKNQFDCYSAAYVSFSVITSTSATAATSSLTITLGQSATLSPTCSSTVTWADGPVTVSRVVSPTATTSYTATCAGSASTCASTFVYYVSPISNTINSCVNMASSGYTTMFINASSATLSWVGKLGSVYSVQWRPVGGNWTTIPSINHASSTATNSYLLSGLTVNTAYEWQVATVCSVSAVSDFSPTQSFTTVCLTPTVFSPTVFPNSANLQWSNTGSSNYTLQWRQQGSGSWNTINSLTVTSYTLTDLVINTVYEYQITSNCSASVSSGSSSLYSFTTQCLAPSTYNPGVSTNSATLYWYSQPQPPSYILQWRPTGSNTGSM